MANYCNCKLTITSDDSATIKEIFAAAAPTEEQRSRWLRLIRPRPRDARADGLLQYLRPMPPELYQAVTNGFSGPEPEWRKWRVEHWGCACDLVADELAVADDGRTVSLRFATMYAPPIAALKHGSKTRGFCFVMWYCEPGVGFAGVATESNITEFELTMDNPPIESGIPQELVDEFELDELYRQRMEESV